MPSSGRRWRRSRGSPGRRAPGAVAAVEEAGERGAAGQLGHLLRHDAGGVLPVLGEVHELEAERSREMAGPAVLRRRDRVAESDEESGAHPASAMAWAVR